MKFQIAFALAFGISSTALAQHTTTQPSNNGTTQQTTKLGDKISTWPAGLHLQAQVPITTYAGNDYVMMVGKKVILPGDDIKGDNSCVLDSNQQSDLARSLMPEDGDHKPIVLDVDGAPQLLPRHTSDDSKVTATQVIFKIKQTAGQQYRELRCWVQGKTPDQVTAADITAQLEDLIKISQ